LWVKYAAQIKQRVLLGYGDFSADCTDSIRIVVG